MRLAMIGLGRMGGNMSERLMKGGHEVVASIGSEEAVKRYVSQGATGAASAEEIPAKLKGPRIVWIMVPAGKPVDDTIASLLPGLSKGDVIIDGGNSNFHDSMRRASDQKERSRVHRRRHQRRSLGAGERILPDDRRIAGGQAVRADLQDARPRGWLRAHGSARMAVTT